MRTTDARIWRVMAARLKSARGVVLLEFGIFAPIVLMVVIFMADFLRVLYCEQQLEIACRALCDIEAHLKPGQRTNPNKDSDLQWYTTGATKHDVSGCPGKPAQLIVYNYLIETLGERIAGNAAADTGSVKMLTRFSDGYGIYPRGYWYNQSGPVHTALNFLCDDKGLANSVEEKCGDGFGDFFSAIQAIFNGTKDFLTFRTHRYIKDVFPTDRVVAVSLSVMADPIFNLYRDGKPAMGLFYRKPTLTDCNGSVIPMYSRDWSVTSGTRRERFYYQMPSFDTAPLAPETYGRHMSGAFAKWITE